MALSPGVFIGTIHNGKLDLDSPNDYRKWIKDQEGKIANGEAGSRWIVRVEEQWSAEAKDFYFKVLRYLREGEMAGWAVADQSQFFKDLYNDGRSITELSREQFDEFLDSVVMWSAQHGLVVPSPNKNYREASGDWG